MSHTRLPVLTFVALALALWLQYSTSPTAQAKSAMPPAPAKAARRAPSSDGSTPIDLTALSGTNHYTKLEKAVGGKAEDISWNDVKDALVDLNTWIPPIASDLSAKMWELAPSSDKRLEWVKSTDWVITVNKYIAQSHSDQESLFLKVNKEFRANTAPGADEQKFADALRASLLKLPSVQGFVFRGAVLPEAELKDKYVAGRPVTEAAFSSSTLNPSTAYSFAFPKEQGFFGAKVKALPEGNVRVLYVIRSKTGKPVSYYSDYWAEAEILFANGSTFNVKAVSAKQADGSVYVLLEEK